jgi:hypothetical protein
MICTGKINTAPKINKDGNDRGREMTLPIKPAATQTLANNTMLHSTWTGVGNVDLLNFNNMFPTVKLNMTDKKATVYTPAKTSTLPHVYKTKADVKNQ